MHGSFGVDVAGAIEIARAAAQFTWTWTARDIDGFAAFAGWTTPMAQRDDGVLTCRTGIRVADPEAAFALGEQGQLEQAWAAVADERKTKHGPVPAAVFETFVDDFRAVYGEPSVRSDDPLFVPSASWVLPDLVLELSAGHRVLLRLVNPARHHSGQERARARRARWAGLSERARSGAAFAECVPIVLASDVGRDFGPRVPGPGPQPRPARRPGFGRRTADTWSRDTVDALCRALGWRLADERSCDCAHGPEHLMLLASRTAEHQQRFGYGRYEWLRLTQALPPGAADAAYRTALRECVRLLGVPHLVGGPDAFAKWRYSDTTVELTRDRDDLALTVLPTHAAEWETSRADEYGEYGEDWFPPLWQAQPDAELGYLLAGTTYQPEPAAADWDEFAHNLERLFASLAADLPVLEPYVTEIAWRLGPAGVPEGTARGWFAPNGGMLEIRRGAQWEQRLYAAGAAAGTEIAAATVAALRAGGAASPRALRGEAHTTRRPQALHTIRFAVGDDDEIDWGLDDPEPDAEERDLELDEDELLLYLVVCARTELELGEAGSAAGSGEDRWVVAPEWRAGAEGFRGLAGPPPARVDPDATAALTHLLGSRRAELTAAVAATGHSGRAAVADAAAAYLAAPATCASALGAAAVWLLVEADHRPCCGSSATHEAHVERDILPRFVDSWLACFGPVFAAEAAVLARGMQVWSGREPHVLTMLDRSCCGPARFDRLIRLVRAHAAALPDAAHQPLAAHLARMRTGIDSVWARLATSYLLPERQDWVDADLRLDGLDRHSHSVAMLVTALTRPDQYRRFQEIAGEPALVADDQLHSMLVQLGPHCAAILPDRLRLAAAGAGDVRRIAGILARTPTDEAYTALLGARADADVREALVAATGRYPHRALRLLEEPVRAAGFRTVAPAPAADIDPVDVATAVRARMGLPPARGRGVPWATLTLTGVCLVVYAILAVQAGSVVVAPETGLFATLRLSATELSHGQWWRPVTAGLLVASPIDALFTLVPLFFAGRYGEMMLGSARFLAVFGTAVLGGAATVIWLGRGSLAFGPDVGTFGIIGVLAVVTWLHHDAALIRLAVAGGAVVVAVALFLNPAGALAITGGLGTAVLAAAGLLVLPRRLNARTAAAARRIGLASVAGLALLATALLAQAAALIA